MESSLLPPWLLQAAVSPWCFWAGSCVIPASASDFLRGAPFSLGLRVLTRPRSHKDSTPEGPPLTEHIGDDPIAKQGHILRSGVRASTHLLGETIQPTVCTFCRKHDDHF